MGSKYLLSKLKFKNPLRYTSNIKINRNDKCVLSQCVVFSRYFSTPRPVSLEGIFPPITTPFDNNEGISYENLSSNLAKMEKIPFKGYVVLGSTGEFVSLSMEEQLQVVKAVKSNISQNKLLIVGTGMESTKGTIEITSKMSELGADAALVISPSFYRSKMTEEALYSHYTKVADSSPIPIILYSVPENTNVDLAAPLIARLADHPNIIGLKDSGGDITKIGHVIHLTKGKQFQVVAGSAGFLYPALCVGCVGGVLALANSLGNYLCRLHQLFKEGQHSAAQDLQLRLIGPNLAVTRWFKIAGVKESMSLCGYYGGPPRSPLKPLSQTEKQILHNEFKASRCL